MAEELRDPVERAVESTGGASSPLPDDLDLLVETYTSEELADFLRLLHPADVADLLDEVDREEHWPKILELLPDDRLAGVLVEAEGALWDDLIERLPPHRLVRLVGLMDSDDAADVVAQLPSDTRDKIIGTLRRRDAQALRQLLQYPEDTAGGLMQTELCKVRPAATVGDAISEIRRRAHDLGESLHAVYVVDAVNRLVGMVPLHRVVLAEEDRPVEDLMEPAAFQVTPEVDQEDVAQLFQKYDLVVLPVVDEDGHLLGRILVDDIVDVMSEEADEDMMRMVGAGEEDLVYSDRIFRISAYRLPWLIVNFFGALATAFVMSRYESLLEGSVVLAYFVPVITAMGGNVGIQSATILTRGFATGRVDEDNISRVFLKELVIGITLGLTCGVLVGLAALLWRGDARLGLVLAIAMSVGMTAATTVGTLAPATLKRFGIDPAISAGPFVTTTNDVLGVLIYLGTATLLLTRVVN